MLGACRRKEMGRQRMADSEPQLGPIAFIASNADEAQISLRRLQALYGDVPPDDAAAIVALGGDGFMLQMLHRFMNTGKPIYGMNRGTVGFLMNEYNEANLTARLSQAVVTTLHPLVMVAVDDAGQEHRSYAINDVYLLRQSYQAAKLRISIDGTERLGELTCDGIIVSTPAGSTAYNLSAHGPILPINAPLLALTPISAFRPRLWRGALLPDRAAVRIDVLEAEKRPVNAVADHFEIKSVRSVEVKQDRAAESLIMFDPDHSWDERILTEQFRY
jgi:NAD+ kinase